MPHSPCWPCLLHSDQVPPPGYSSKIQNKGKPASRLFYNMVPADLICQPSLPAFPSAFHTCFSEIMASYNMLTVNIKVEQNLVVSAFF